MTAIKDKLVTVEGLGYVADNVVIVSSSEPSTAYNKIWIDSDGESTQVPTYTEFTNAVTLTQLADSTDLNNVTAVGNYYMSSARTYTNNPAPSGQACVLYVTGTSLDGTNSSVVQLLVQGGIGRIYIRALSSGNTWGSWHSIIDTTLAISGAAADAKVTGDAIAGNEARQKLLNDEVPNTTQSYTFTDGSVSKVEHLSGTTAIRTDVFTYGTNTITETRTLNSGEVLTIVTNLTTLQTTVTYTE